MNRPRSNSTLSWRARRPSGAVYRGLLFIVPIVLAVGLLAWFGPPKLSLSSEESGPMMHVVKRGTFIHDVTENGSVESANNVEIRCEVEARGASGTMILWIIPEGTYVEPAPDWEPKEPDEEAPDLLVKLDSSSLEDKRTQQQLKCNSSEASVIQARNNYETTKIALEEYVEGTYQEDRKGIEGSMLLAEESLVRQAQYLEDSKLLHAKGFISDRELEADAFLVAQKKIALEELKTRLLVLERYSKPRNLLDKEAAIKIAEARLKSEEHSHQLDLNELEEVEEQIEKCTIRAPQAGQVVYANVTNNRGGQETVIEEGTTVRERQSIIKLPDSNNMQVKAKINEARVSRVQVGMKATIRLDAFPDLDPMSGTVEKVNEYPLPSGWWSGDIKEYETVIKIDSFPKDLDMRPGMTAEVKIRVERVDDALLVPVQAVVEHGGKHYCAARDGEEWKKCEVTIGSTNEKEVVIQEGLAAGEEVALGAALYRDDLDLPEIVEESDAALDSPGVSPTSGQDKPATAKSKPPSGDSKPAARPGQPGAAGPQGGGRPNLAEAFKSADKNGDGKLEGDEISGRMKESLSSIDTNSDGAVSQTEFNAMIQRMRTRGGGPQGTGGKPAAGGAQGGAGRPAGQGARS
ncbi:MAG: HlyD family efflux transporter periplasmic adaptor subunit [Planctomycetes bacterium]|nr:HlyD family efflux transporter periplasmic adaptor subunit [Planctomycetota bacterium]